MDFLHQMQMVDWLRVFGVALGAYALGCLTTGYYLFRFRTGRDLRELGSGSVGARNAGRFLGASGFLITLLCDFGKGVLAVWCAQYLTGDKQLAAIALLAAIIGHIWPLQLGLRGGKGVATAVGGVAMYDVRLLLWLLCFFAVGLVIFRKSVVPGLLAFLCLPIVPLSILFRGPNQVDLADAVTTCVLAFLVLFAHRRNIAEELFKLYRSHSLESSPKTKL
jgi:acyl phosphate:glycerol-3-phosphate acyltransferase